VVVAAEYVWDRASGRDRSIHMPCIGAHDHGDHDEYTLVGSCGVDTRGRSSGVMADVEHGLAQTEFMSNAFHTSPALVTRHDNK